MFIWNMTQHVCFVQSAAQCIIERLIAGVTAVGWSAAHFDRPLIDSTLDVYNWEFSNGSDIVVEKWIRKAARDKNTWWAIFIRRFDATCPSKQA
jgi:hypothetical protein